MRYAVSVFAFSMLAGSAGLLGQGLGSLTGVVTDVSGALVPGALVEATHTQTGVASRAETNGAGVFRFASLGIGDYEIRVTASGFKAWNQRGVLLETDRAVRLDAVLEVGAAQESVTVSSEAPLLEKESSVVATQISRDMVSKLPYQLTGSIRNPFAFVQLTPGAQGASGAAEGIRIAGSRTYANEVYIDGVPMSYNAGQNVAGPGAPSLDTVAEFRVETAFTPAEIGRTAGGAVMMASRSGTNQYRGNLIALFRNGVLDARRYNAAHADVTRQGEFGGSLGGPLVLPRIHDGHNRTFFFGNYTGFRRLNDVQGRTGTLATAAMRAGDFAESVERIFDPATVNAAQQRQPFPSNRIPASRISPFASKFQGVIPLPNGTGLANNHLGALPSILDLNSYFAKLDHQFTPRHRVNGSYRLRFEDRLNSNGFILPISDIIDQGIDIRNLVFAYDFIVRPNVISRLQLGITRFYSPLTESGDIGLSVPGAFESGFPGVRFQGQGLTGFGFGADRFTTSTNSNLQYSVAWTSGKHNWKFGFRTDYYQFNQATLGFREGQYTFSQFATSQPQVARTGHSYASFLLGAVNSATMALNAPTGDRSKYFGFFAQDDFKITRKLTINYGYRWEFQIPFYEMYDRLSRMDPDAINPAAPGLRGAVVFAGNGPGRSGVRNFIATYYGAHAPRLGLAYQAGTKTVRAGAGLFHSPQVGIDNNKQGFNASIDASTLDGGLTPAFQIDAGWPAGTVKAPPFIDPTIANGQNATTTEFRPGGSGRLPRTSQWQFSVQHVERGILLDATYVGTMAHGITNNSLVSVNQIEPRYLGLGSLLTRSITDPLVVAAGYRPPYTGFRGTLAQSLRAFPQYLTVTTLDVPTGNSTYHALFLKSERRFSSGLQFLASYAVSKSISDISFTNIDLARPQDQYNRRAEKGLTDVDVPQRMAASFSYDLPVFAKKRLLGGWGVAGILTYESGAPLRINTPNNLPIFNGHLRPNHTGAPIRVGPGRSGFQPQNALTGQAGDLFLNRDAFTAPPPFTLGTLGTFLPNVRGFGIRNENLSVVKTVLFAEKRRIEIRADLFNAFNRRNLTDPVTDLSNPAFGRINGQGAARIVQLGFRMDF
jgi:hypothetical protein